MLFYKHKNSFILPPYVRVRSYARVRTHDEFGRKISPDGGILSPYVRVRIMTSLPCVRTQRHLHTQKTADVICRENFARWGDTLSVRTRAHPRAHLDFWREKSRYMGGDTTSVRTRTHA